MHHPPVTTSPSLERNPQSAQRNTMRRILPLLALISAALAKPGYLSASSTYTLTSSPLGPNGRVLDASEVAIARAGHTASHLNQRINLASEAARTSSSQLRLVTPLARSGIFALVPAPIGINGEVVDTPEVAAAKAAHAAAHANERITLANEAARSEGNLAGMTPAMSSEQPPSTEVMVGPDGRLLDTPEVAAAKAAHAAAHINQKIHLIKEAARSGGDELQISSDSEEPEKDEDEGNSIGHGAPVGPDGRVLDTPEVAAAKRAHAAIQANEQAKLAKHVQPANVLAVAGPGVAYSGLLY